MRIEEIRTPDIYFYDNEEFLLKQKKDYISAVRQDITFKIIDESGVNDSIKVFMRMVFFIVKTPKGKYTVSKKVNEATRKPGKEAVFVKFEGSDKRIPLKENISRDEIVSIVNSSGSKSMFGDPKNLKDRFSKAKREFTFFFLDLLKRNIGNHRNDLEELGASWIIDDINDFNPEYQMFKNIIYYSTNSVPKEVKEPFLLLMRKVYTEENFDVYKNGFILPYKIGSLANDKVEDNGHLERMFMELHSWDPVKKNIVSGNGYVSRECDRLVMECLRRAGWDYSDAYMYTRTDQLRLEI